MNKTLTILGVVTFALLAVGLVVLASASSVNGLRLHNDPHHFVIHQAAWIGIGLSLALAAAFFDYHKWREYPWLTVLLYVALAVLMVAVLNTKAVKGSHRWFRLGPVKMQPSEFAKIFVVIATAVFIDKLGWRIEKFWKGAVATAAVVGLPVALAVAEPDFGAAFVTAVGGGVVIFVGGMRWLHMGVLFVTGLAGVLPFLLKNANRMHRIIGWLPPELSAALGMAPVDEKDVEGVNHQLKQALVAIENGGLTGRGFMESRQNQEYLPEAHTDFIFAIGAEEMGLIFSLVLLALFIAFFVCGMRVAARAPDRLGRLIAYGVTFLLFFQAMFNMGVVTGCLPTKGIALPFISYGGTNLMTALLSVGILFNIGRQAKPRPVHIYGHSRTPLV